MKKLITLLTLSLLVLPLCAEEPINQEIAVQEATECDPNLIAESLGHLIVRHLANPGFVLDLDRVIKGIEDERNGIESPLSEEEYEQAILAIQEKNFTRVATENLVKANSFLEANSTETGVNVIEQKLQYRVVQAGEGETVGEECCPLIHYRGSLLDGTVFANSFEGAADPITLPLKQTIPGFAKGLVGMKEGEKRTLYIHPELAYGLVGHLPPNSLLIFEVEVVKANNSTEIAQQNATTEEAVR